MEDVRVNAELDVMNGLMRDSPRHIRDAGEGGIPAVLEAPVTDEVVVDVVDESPAKPEPDPAARSRFRRLRRELPACSTQRARRSGSGRS